ncbi:MAG: YggS family pyridoxal phosphate-dependent enzyme, partial [Gemmatimonadota bacterium]
MNGATEDLELGADYAGRLADTLPRVRERMTRAAETAGRRLDDVRLVAVTKGHPLEALRAALEAGLEDLGENRVEELEEKVGALGRAAARWHMIGHLQRRKAPRAIELADLIHSVDSLRLAERLSRVAGDRMGSGEGDKVPILVQVNTSGEESKAGFEPAQAVEEVHRIAELPHLRVYGLMTMAPLVDDEATLVSTFRRLRETLEAVRALHPGVGTELSMGMTN